MSCGPPVDLTFAVSKPKVGRVSPLSISSCDLGSYSGRVVSSKCVDREVAQVLQKPCRATLSRYTLSHYLLKARKPTPNPKVSKRTPRSCKLHEFFRKLRANFHHLSCDTSQDPNGDCSEQLVQMNFFILGGGIFLLGITCSRIWMGSQENRTTIRPEVITN